MPDSPLLMVIGVDATDGISRRCVFVADTLLEPITQASITGVLEPYR